MPNAEELFGRHYRDVLRYLAHMTGQPNEAEDLAQEVFLRVVRALENGASILHERGWIFSIARNLLVDRRRGQQRQASDGEVHEQAVEGSQSIAYDLRQCLGQIPSTDREAFLLKEVGGLSYQEIAEACSCTVESVRARLHRTRMALRSLMSPSAFDCHKRR